MTAEAWIIDGYVDEPACLGVPPYISPYIRTIAGVLTDYGNTVRYCTIDQIRSDPAYLQTAGKAEIAVMIAGVTVPGKYLGGTPASYADIRQVGSTLIEPETFLGGPILFGTSPGGGRKAFRHEDFGFDHLLHGSPSQTLDAILSGSDHIPEHAYPEEDRWGILGAEIVQQHPLYPLVMVELETARGCSHGSTGGCSFCTEPFYGTPAYREADAVIAEVSALHQAGVRHFRLGRQPDLLTYQAGPGEFPAPDPDALTALFFGIREAAPDLQTLHIDNINPGTIARNPDESRSALSVIVRYHTPGDVAAFGMESADPAVIQANNLKAYPDDVMEAIRIVNEVGGGRQAGIPHLLPGLNFILGLAGETKETYRMNQEFLQDILKENMLVRRVNIRQLMPFEGTRAWDSHTLPVDEKELRRFKEDVRKEFDLPMLRRVYPAMTVVPDVIIEQEGDTSFGRQLGSYPILIGIPFRVPVRTVMSVVIVDHGMRSLTALPWPIPINHLPVKAIRLIPGLGKKGQIQILAKRPIPDHTTLERVSGMTLPFGHFSFRSQEVPSP